MAQTLEEIVAMYGIHNDEKNSITKICKTENEQIKTSLVAQGITEFTAGGYTVKYTESESEVVDEAKMVEVLKKYWSSSKNNEPCPFIRTVEALDSDALEKAMYAGDIPKSVMLEMDACITIKKTPKLLCSKVKPKREVDENGHS